MGDKPYPAGVFLKLRVVEALRWRQSMHAGTFRRAMGIRLGHENSIQKSRRAKSIGKANAPANRISLDREEITFSFIACYGESKTVRDL
jgi:hypothetical protein